MRFEDFTNEELAVIGVGLAFAGTVGDMREKAQPILHELNIELEKPERQKK